MGRLFGDETALAAQKPTRAETVEKDHGRIETRRAVALAATALFGGIRGLAAWAGVQSVAMVEARREPAGGGAASVERRYFLSSLPPDAARLLQVARGHWAIENNLHWMLDVHFDEDRCRVRKDHAPLNLATVRPGRPEPGQARHALQDQRAPAPQAGGLGRRLPLSPTQHLDAFALHPG